jgi:hypothetical protein
MHDIGTRAIVKAQLEEHGCQPNGRNHNEGKWTEKRSPIRVQHDERQHSAKQRGGEHGPAVRLRPNLGHDFGGVIYFRQGGLGRNPIVDIVWPWLRVLTIVALCLTRSPPADTVNVTRYPQPPRGLVAFEPRHIRGRYRLAVAFLISFLQLVLVPGALAVNYLALTPQARVGLAVGDQWEPAIAADGFGHVYILYPQYGRIPGCTACPMPSMILVVSEDNGATWQSPREITPPASGEFDAQIVVDSADQKTVYAAWLQNDKRDTVVAKSTDFGQSWSMVVADHASSESDKPVLAVRGLDIYVGFSRSRKIWVASSHDGGATFTSTTVNSSSRFAEALAGGATVTPQGHAFISWTGYPQNDGLNGRANLYVSDSSDGGATWKSTLMDLSGAPPDCSSAHCESGYLGAQIAIASDAAGGLFALWNSGQVDKGPERIYFSSSVNGGANWTSKVDVSDAPEGVEHAFPALAAGAEGDVRIAWMDSRNDPDWNTFYRSSPNGGGIWRSQRQISSYVKGYRYVHANGFSFPFGDYFEIAIDSEGQTQAVWGEGQNYKSPGSIWHAIVR